MKKSVDVIAGARPNFMKIAPILSALKARKEVELEIHFRLVHTGQHYDEQMSGSFFKELGIPAPDCNLNSGSGTQAEQTADIMVRYEKLLLTSKPDLCIVVGDVTSTMACAICAQKISVPVAHVEAGIRSGDWAMPEEINRMVTDSITNYFFTTSRLANENLRQSGVEESRIFFVGNTMIDTLLCNEHRLTKPEFWEEHNLFPQQYFVLTLHRPGNVDEVESFHNLISAISENTRNLPVVFPVHPRTAKTINEIGSISKNLLLVNPQSYLCFNYLVKHAKGVITDSGGITEETTVLGVPCITLRDSTERPETVTIGTNELIGTDPRKMKLAFDRLFEGKWKKGAIPEKWDGKTGERIVKHLVGLFSQG
jgi:UDP-N-acetylglucosamine 2-epimerase (non-hydrolysing)